MPMAESSGFYRLACERCRGQKLRCNWTDRRPDASCNRCIRAGVVCKTNYSRRIGRPPRSNGSDTTQQPQWSVLATTSPTASTIAPSKVAAEELHQQHQNPEQDEFGSAMQQIQPQEVCDSGDASNDEMLGLDALSSGASAMATNNTALNQPKASNAQEVNQFALGDLQASETNEERAWLAYLDLDTAIGPELAVGRSFSLSSSTLSNEYPSTNFSFDLSTGGAEASLPGPSYARGPRSQTSNSPISGMTPVDWRQELGKLGAALFELPPAHPQQPVPQSGVWIRLVPKVVGHAKTLYRLVNLASSTYTPRPTLPIKTSRHQRKASQASDDQLPMDRPTWLILLSCYTRILQICRYTLANIHMALKTDRGLLSVLQLEGTMMLEDEPHLKVLLLLQVLSYRLNMIAGSLGLPKRHRVQGSGMAGGDRAANTELGLDTISDSAVDWALSGDAAERSVFGSADCQKENITAAFLAEYEIITTLISNAEH